MYIYIYIYIYKLVFCQLKIEKNIDGFNIDSIYMDSVVVSTTFIFCLTKSFQKFKSVNIPLF